jgi:hypothetical protein
MRFKTSSPDEAHRNPEFIFLFSLSGPDAQINQAPLLDLDSHEIHAAISTIQPKKEKPSAYLAPKMYSTIAIAKRTRADK